MPLGKFLSRQNGATQRIVTLLWGCVVIYPTENITANDSPKSGYILWAPNLSATHNSMQSYD